MPIIGDIGYLLEVFGLDDSLRAFDQFQRRADTVGNVVSSSASMVSAALDQWATSATDTAQSFTASANLIDTTVERTTVAHGKMTERQLENSDKLSKSTTLQIALWAGVGSAVAQTFLDVLRESTVLSVMLGTLSNYFGAIADTILKEVMPAFREHLMPVLKDTLDAIRALNPEVRKLGGELALLGGAALIAARIHPLLGLFVAIGGAAFILNDELDKMNKERFGPLADAYDEFQKRFSTKVFDDMAAAIGGVSAAIGKAFGTGAGSSWETINTFITNSKNSIGGFVDWLKAIDWGLAARALQDTFSGSITLGGGFKDSWNALVTLFEIAHNLFIDFQNATNYPWEPDKPHVNYPRLQRGGRITETGAAVVHAGEEVLTEKRVEALERIAHLAATPETGRPATFAIPTSVTIHVHISTPPRPIGTESPEEWDARLRDMARAVGEISGERYLQVVRRRT